MMIALIIVFGIGTIDCTVAGETVKIKSSATSINTKWHPIEVGDVEGHVVAVFQNTQVYVSEITGETMTAFSRGTMDLNTKTGQGTMKGYSVMTYPSGDKKFASYEGKKVGKGRWKGTYTDMDGTGKYKGITGGGTWESKSLARGISHVYAEGERTFQ
jgi:ribosomal protein S11